MTRVTSPPIQSTIASIVRRGVQHLGRRHPPSSQAIGSATGGRRGRAGSLPQVQRGDQACTLPGHRDPRHVDADRRGRERAHHEVVAVDVSGAKATPNRAGRGGPRRDRPAKSDREPRTCAADAASTSHQRGPLSHNAAGRPGAAIASARVGGWRDRPRNTDCADGDVESIVARVTSPHRQQSGFALLHKRPPAASPAWCAPRPPRRRWDGWRRAVRFRPGEDADAVVGAGAGRQEEDRLRTG